MTLEQFRKKRSAGKRKAILAAAGESFRKEGFARTSMETVARNAKVSTATLYRQFTSKEDLFDAVVTETMDELALSEGVTGNAKASLRALARAYARLLSQPETRGMFRMVVAECGRDAALADRFYKAVKSRLSDLFVDAIAREVMAGKVKRLNAPDHVAGQLQGMIEHSTLLRGLVMGDEIETLAEADHIAEEALKTWVARWGS